MLLTVVLLAAWTPSPVSRREAVTTLLAASPYTTSSLWGLAPPPISGQWSYEQLLDEAHQGHVATVQVAVQHDCVVATTTSGRRYSCLMPDDAVGQLELDALGTDGTLPFRVLPPDARRAAVRDAAGKFFALTVVVWSTIFAASR